MSTVMASSVTHSIFNLFNMGVDRFAGDRSQKIMERKGTASVYVCLWVCYHDNTKLRASILAKLGL